MKIEKVIVSLIAVLIGILAAGAAFYFYQTTKVIPESKTKTISIVPPSPIPKTTIFLTVDSPKDEDVVDKRVLAVSGKTIPDATIIISTQNLDQVITPASNGNFSSTLELDDGQNKIEITAIAPNGEEVKLVKTVTYSTENF